MPTATAIALPNIALIKYWGDREPRLRLPANGSISMNLAGLYTRTSVIFDPAFQADALTLNGYPLKGQALNRVSGLLAQVRRLAGFHEYAQVTSENNFPTGAGIASSASAFAALALAAAAAAGLSLDEQQLSRLARTGSGSACRSVPGGFVEWQVGVSDEDSYAFSIAAPEHWALADCIALISQEHKDVSSREGHVLADTSPLQPARLADTPRRLSLCRQALLERDFALLADVAEMDCLHDARRDANLQPASALLAARYPGGDAGSGGLAALGFACLLHHRRRSQCARLLPGGAGLAGRSPAAPGSGRAGSAYRPARRSGSVRILLEKPPQICCNPDFSPRRDIISGNYGARVIFPAAIDGYERIMLVG